MIVSGGTSSLTVQPAPPTDAAGTAAPASFHDLLATAAPVATDGSKAPVPPAKAAPEKDDEAKDGTPDDSAQTPDDASTALIASPENRNTTAAPRIRPTRIRSHRLPWRRERFANGVTGPSVGNGRSRAGAWAWARELARSASAWARSSRSTRSASNRAPRPGSAVRSRSSCMARQKAATASSVSAVF